MMLRTLILLFCTCLTLAQPVLEEFYYGDIDRQYYLYIPESNDPDLIIRTGGEIRLSNFMLWRSAYSELYFTKTLWPDFKITSLNKILHSYLKRNRKIGK